MTGRISVVVPVLDDLDGTNELLQALAAQSLLPAECVVVDGGSTDGTVELLESWVGPFPVRVVKLPGRNIARARNAGIEAAGNDWIACTDAGCRPVPAWLEAIEAARNLADFVAGVVEIDARTPLERVLAIAHYPSSAELDHPALWIRIAQRLFGRGYVHDRVGGAYMAFSKEAWRAAGGFPENLYAGEDRAFTSAVIHAGCRVTRSPDAAVRWRPPARWIGNAKMFYTYSRGDIRSPGRTRHLVRLAAWVIALRSATAGWRGRLAIALGAGAYISLPLDRAVRERLPLRDWWRIPLVVALKDLSQMAGAARGLIDAVQGVPQPAPRRRAG